MNKKNIIMIGIALIFVSIGVYAGTLHVDGNMWIWEKLKINNYYMPLLDGDANQVIMTDGNGNLFWTDANVSGSSEIENWCITEGVCLEYDSNTTNFYIG
jgi:hypothetical protein